jgi:hypothetical protein
MADGTLRRISDCTWGGTLKGYSVWVTFYHQEGWWYHVAHAPALLRQPAGDQGSPDASNVSLAYQQKLADDDLVCGTRWQGDLHALDISSKAILR